MPSSSSIKQKKIGLGILFIFFGLFIISFTAFYLVGAGERAVVVTLGKASDVSQMPGFHLKIPIVQEAVKFDIKTQKYEANASAASSDLQTVNTELAINYHVEPNSVPRLYREVGIDYSDRIIQPLEQEIVKATTAKYTAEELITKREQVREDMKALLAEKLMPRGIVVEEVSIVNFDFSQSFNEAIEKKVTAEQNSLAAKNKLSQIEYEAQQQVVAAKGEAEAIRIKTAAIQAQGGKEYVQLQAVQKWNGNLPMVFGGGSIPFINFPMYNGNQTPGNSTA